MVYMSSEGMQYQLASHLSQAAASTSVYSVTNYQIHTTKFHVP